MTSTPEVDHLNSRVLELERALHALSTAPQSPNRAQRGGTYKLLDGNGDAVFFFGEFTHGASEAAYGVKCVVPGGAGPGTSPTVFEADNDGLEAPWLDIPVEKNGEFVAVTSGTFAAIWTGHAMLTVARAIKVVGSINCDAATTGEVRVVVGAVTSAVVSCAANSQTNYDYKLLLTANTLGSGLLVPQLQVRRVTGAGNVNVYTPAMAQVGDDGAGATATGL